MLLWLYLLSIAVLIGAALNAAFDQIWPQKELTKARMERLKRLKLENVLPWRTSLERADSEQERSAKANDPGKDDVGMEEPGKKVAEPPADTPSGSSAP